MRDKIKLNDQILMHFSAREEYCTNIECLKFHENIEIKISMQLELFV